MRILIAAVTAGLLSLGSASAQDLEEAKAALAAGNYDAAAPMLAALADSDPAAAYFLGFLRQRGLGGAQDLAAAEALYRQAAEGGIPAAAYNLAVMVQDQDPTQARAWLDQAAGTTYVPALRALALAATEGTLGFETPDPAAAAAYHLEAAEAGSIEDARAAMALYDVGGEAGQDDTAWFKAALAAALAEDPQAYWHLYQAYEAGRGTAANVALGLPWLRKAADAKIIPAMRELALLSEQGQVVTQDPGLALALFAEAAEGGDPTSLLRMADAYARGDGVPMDIDQALYYLNEAYGQGEAEAGVSLGRLYLSGRLEGVENLPFAVSWFDAARQLLPPGADQAEAEALYLSTLGRLPDEAARETARRLAQEHVAQFPAPARPAPTPEPSP